jgi:hypothetical protein
MKRNRLFLSIIIVFCFAISIAKYRESISCNFVEYLNFDKVQDNVFVSKDMNHKERESFLNLVDQAFARVQQVYRYTNNKPIFIASASSSSLKPYFSNEYGSTAFAPGRACVVIGPKGLNVDVISHELVHAEIFHLLGYWKRLLLLPVWFDEGAAMQVDFRTLYTEQKYIGPTDQLYKIESLRYGFQFYSGDDEELTRHYAMAKEHLRLFLEKIGYPQMFSFIKQVKDTYNFKDTYNKAVSDGL